MIFFSSKKVSGILFRAQKMNNGLSSSVWPQSDKNLSSSSTSTPPIIISQHSEDASFLWLLRNTVARAPHCDLKDLAKHDNRIEAHIDGLRVAGEDGWALAAEQLRYEEPGEVFAAGVLALESKAGARIIQVLEVAERVPETTRGLISALGWVHPKDLQGTGKALLDAEQPFLRRLGIAACAIHRVDPGPALIDAMADADPALRARALRAAGELGRHDLLQELKDRGTDEDDACRFWAAWSSVLLGDRGGAVLMLKQATMLNSAFQYRAMQIVARVLPADAAHGWLKSLSGNPALLRALIIAVGAHGDPTYIPWLITQMQIPEAARVAGEAFSMITGVDLAYDDLDGEWPDGFEAGPTENPEDEDVAMDADEDLPWPAPELIERWWSTNANRFAAGRRYLCGKPISATHCRDVLVTGYQRQRIAAALELALMQPAAPLFETRAPGFRQQRMLKSPEATV